MTAIRHILALALTFALLGTAQAAAQAVVSTGQSFLQARILPGERVEDGVRVAGLRMTVTPGWKTYWRDPGEAGIPPYFDWSASQNIENVEVMWPRPEIFMSFGMRTVGYSGDLVIPVKLTPKDPSQPMVLAVNARIGVCREICVIEEVVLSEEIAPDLRPIGYKQIRRSMRTVPMPASEAGLTVAACRITGAGRDWKMSAELDFDKDPGRTDVVVEGNDRLWIRKTEVKRNGHSVHVDAGLRLPKDVSWVDRSTVRMTVLAEEFSADIRGCKNTG